LGRGRRVSHLLVVAGGGGDDVAVGQVGERGLHCVRIHPCRLFPFVLLAPASPFSPAAVEARRICFGFVWGYKSEVMQPRAQGREALYGRC
jgi:hypothetical protein